MRDEKDRKTTAPTDEEIAEDASGMGDAGISRATGTGRSGSGVPAGGGTRLSGVADDATSKPATDEAEDLADAAGPSAARSGDIGTAGTARGAGRNAATPPESGTKTGKEAHDPAGSNTTGNTESRRGRAGGGSGAGGGGD